MISSNFTVDAIKTRLVYLNPSRTDYSNYLLTGLSQSFICEL